MSNCHRKESRKCFLLGLLIRPSTAEGVAIYQTNSYSDTNIVTTNSLQILQVLLSSSSPVFWCHLCPDLLQPVLQTAQDQPQSCTPHAKAGAHCSTPKGTKQWCVGTKTHPKHPKLQRDSFPCSYLNHLGKMCVQDPESLYHINAYAVCPKERAGMLSHKLGITYNSTRHRGKSRPPLPQHKKVNKLVCFQSRRASDFSYSTKFTETPSDAGCTKKKNKTKPKLKKKKNISQNRTESCTCASYSQWNFIHFVPQKEITFPRLGFYSHLFQWPPNFQIRFYTLKYLQIHDLSN